MQKQILAVLMTGLVVSGGAWAKSDHAVCMCSHPQHIQSIISSVYHLYRQYKQDIYHG